MVTWRRRGSIPCRGAAGTGPEDGQALLLTLGSCRIDMAISEGLSHSAVEPGGRAETFRTEGNRHRWVLQEDRRRA